MLLRSLIFASFCVIGISPSVHAQSLPLSEKDRISHQAEADLWLDTVFGYCLSQIEDTTFEDHPAELQGEWSDLRPDYASTLLKRLYAPKVSALPGAVILDINEKATSCWTQYSSLVPEYASSELLKVRTELAAQDRLKTAVVDQGRGPKQVDVMLVGGDRVPVIFYQAVTPQGQITNVVTIIQKTVSDFKYVD